MATWCVGCVELGLRLVLSFLLHFDRCKLMPRQHNRTFIFLLVAVALSLTSAHAEGTPPPANTLHFTTSSSFFYLFFSVIDGVTTQWCTQLNLSPDANNTIVLGSSLSSTLPFI